MHCAACNVLHRSPRGRHPPGSRTPAPAPRCGWAAPGRSWTRRRRPPWPVGMVKREEHEHFRVGAVKLETAPGRSWTRRRRPPWPVQNGSEQREQWWLSAAKVEAALGHSYTRHCLHCNLGIRKAWGVAQACHSRGKRGIAVQQLLHTQAPDHPRTSTTVAVTSLPALSNRSPAGS